MDTLSPNTNVIAHRYPNQPVFWLNPKICFSWSKIIPYLNQSTIKETTIGIDLISCLYPKEEWAQRTIYNKGMYLVCRKCMYSFLLFIFADYRTLLSRTENKSTDITFATGGTNILLGVFLFFILIQFYLSRNLRYFWY